MIVIERHPLKLAHSIEILRFDHILLAGAGYAEGLDPWGSAHAFPFQY